MTTPSPLLVVVGATGKQGRSVIDAFLSLRQTSAQQTWRIRGLTRTPSSSAAQDLSKQGIEIVQADQDDPAFLTKAFAGATAIFAYTDYWTPAFSPSSQSSAQAAGKSLPEYIYDLEVQRGKNIVDAAASVGTLDRFVWSSLANVSELSDGKYTAARHFDGKAAIEQYARHTYPELERKMSTVQAGYFFSNVFAPINQPKSQQGDAESQQKTYTIMINGPAGAKHPWISMDEDFGLLVRGLITEEEPGTNLLAVSEWISWDDIAHIWTGLSGAKVVLQEKSVQEMEAMIPMFGADIAQSTLWSAEFGFDGGRAKRPEAMKTKWAMKKLGRWVQTQDWKSSLQ